MFEEIYLLSTTFAWYSLSGREVVRARFFERDETLYLRLESRLEDPGFLRLALHIARDEETLRAWREGLIGEWQVTVTAVRRSELSAAAKAEWVKLGSEPYDLLPRVTVGLDGREPGVSEWHVSERALEAFNLLFDPFEDSSEGVQRRVLASGEEVELEVLAPEYDAFPKNDGGIRALSDGVPGARVGASPVQGVSAAPHGM
jgi:hypothetical protein